MICCLNVEVIHNKFIEFVFNVTVKNHFFRARFKLERRFSLLPGGDHFEPLVLLEPAFASPVTRATRTGLFFACTEDMEFSILRTTVLKSSCDATIVERS